MATTGNQKILL